MICVSSSRNGCPVCGADILVHINLTEANSPQGESGVVAALLGGVMDEIGQNGKPRQWVKAKQVVKGMKPWCEKINHKATDERDGRTINEACFDSGVFAASELIRRLTGDEELSLAVHEMCIWRQREHEKQKARSVKSKKAKK